jgi:hypothetical protein
VYPAIERLFNKPGHGLARADLLELPDRLFRAGDIVATSKAGTQFTPTAAQIEAEVKDRPFNQRNQSVCYGLTPKGGARWEMAARADWARYIADWRTVTDHLFDGKPVESVEIVTPDRGRLNEYLSLLRAHFDDVLPRSEEWDVLRPWHATYWKRLPLAHRVRFRSVERTMPPPRERNLSRLLSQMSEWYAPPTRG